MRRRRDGMDMRVMYSLERSEKVADCSGLIVSIASPWEKCSATRARIQSSVNGGLVCTGLLSAHLAVPVKRHNGVSAREPCRTHNYHKHQAKEAQMF